MFRFLSYLAAISSLLVACQGEENRDGMSTPDPRKHDGLASIGESLLPSPGEEHQREERNKARELAETIESIRGVDEARVHLDLADRSLLSRNRDAKSQAAIVVLRSGEDGPSEDTLRSLATSAIAGLAPERVRVFISTRTPVETETVFIGPIEVAASSVGVARACLGSLLSICLVLAVGMIVAGVKLRQHRTSSPPQQY